MAGGGNRPPKHPPHHQLAQLRKLLPGYVFRGHVIDRAMEFVAAPDRASALPIMRAVMMSLTEVDFFHAHSRLLAGRGGVNLDDYAKLDDYGLWFIKFDITDGRLTVHSCHESRDDEVELHNGTILRKTDK